MMVFLVALNHTGRCFSKPSILISVYNVMEKGCRKTGDGSAFYHATITVATDDNSLCAGPKFWKPTHRAHHV